MNACDPPPWFIELAPGWIAETRTHANYGEFTQYVEINPETNDAMLRLSTFSTAGVGIDAAGWTEFYARINRSKGRRVEFIRCGDFAGYLVEFTAKSDWIRGWALCSASIPLDVSYRCTAEIIGRDDPIVDAMLQTLQIYNSRSD